MKKFLRSFTIAIVILSLCIPVAFAQTSTPQGKLGTKENPIILHASDPSVTPNIIPISGSNFISINETSTGAVYVTWSSVSGTNHYMINVADVNSDISIFPEPGGRNVGSSTSYTIVKSYFTIGTEYRLWVAAIDASGGIIKEDLLYFIYDK